MAWGVQQLLHQHGDRSENPPNSDCITESTSVTPSFLLRWTVETEFPDAHRPTSVLYTATQSLF